jgi:small subunit ribosomal protein S21
VTKISVGQNENLERALRRLKKKVEREGVLKILKARKHYEKPSEVKRRQRRNSAKKKTLVP